MTKVTPKTPEELAIMQEGGRRLAKVRDHLFDEVKEGVSAGEIERIANEMIESEGGQASFKMVPRYKWATCVNVNDGVVHGIPHPHIVFKQGDLVSVDVGMYYKGFHTDTSFSKLIGKDLKKQEFLDAGKESLANAIKAAIVGNTVGDISHAMEQTLKKYHLNPIKALTGHGIGKNLHEDPLIPCFVSNQSYERTKLIEGMTIAIEVMYTEGSGNLVLEDDSWTLSTKDAKIASLFEETVAVTSAGPIILTDQNSVSMKVYGKE